MSYRKHVISKKLVFWLTWITIKIEKRKNKCSITIRREKNRKKNHINILKLQLKYNLKYQYNKSHKIKKNKNY